MKQLLNEIIEGDDKVLTDPAPQVFVKELADSSVNFGVRVWVNSADYCSVLWDTTETVKLRFDEKGFSVPYPQQDTYLRQVESAKDAA